MPVETVRSRPRRGAGAGAGGRLAGQALRRARRLPRLSLRQLAGRAGTSHATVAAYEAGRTDPGVATLARLVRAAGYGLELELAPRADASPEARRAKGEELAEVLLLAEQFPARHAPTLDAPVYGRTGGG